MLASRPHLNVIGLGGGKPHISGAQHHDLIREFQALKDHLSMSQERFKLFIRIFRGCESDQLNLVELMLSDQPPRVLAVRAGFRPEARRVGRVEQGQVPLIQDFVLVNVGDRHLGSGH